MLYKVIAYLFRNDDYHYTAKPLHLVWSIFIMAIGTVTFTYNDWIAFGTVTFIIGALLGVSIVIRIAWDGFTEYWDTVTSFAQVMIKSNNPDLWQALGFKHPPEMITIQEVNPETKDHGWQQINHRLPVSPATMQMIADKVLMSGNTDFIESEYSNIPNIRKVRNTLKQEGLLSPKNNKNVRMGYTFNRKGVDSLYQYASESIRMELNRR